jgi:hypothetical protein
MAYADAAAAATTNNKRIERTVRGRKNFKDLNSLTYSLYGKKSAVVFCQINENRSVLHY